MLVRLSVARRGLCTNAPPAATDAIRALYRRGSGRRKVGPGQPRVVALVTGGGGSLFSWMLSEAGASSCLLEGRVPYAKESLVAFLAEHNRTIDGVGFCSAPMAGRMAEAARDRGLMLTQKLDQWPDVIGVASTATIVSHYKRRGDYRVHAASCTGPDAAVTAYSHNLVKGARERPAEDAACALLTLRALTEAAGIEEIQDARWHRALATCGLRLEDVPSANAVGETASGVEVVPEPIPTPPSPDVAAQPRAFIPRSAGAAGSHAIVPLPLGRNLPPGTIIVPYVHESIEAATKAAAEALSALGRLGDGGDGAWSEPQAPVLFEAPDGQEAASWLEGMVEHASAARLTNWAVLATDAIPDAAALISPDIPAHILRVFHVCYPGSTILVTPSIASELADLEHEVNTGDAAFVVARPTNDFDAEAEASCFADREALPDEMIDSFVFVSDHWHEGSLDGLSDGSPSTEGVKGLYDGGWDQTNQWPQGYGVMEWENGITYTGHWKDGKYEGYGSKMYSKGGGYAGMWKVGSRQGYGTSFYHGKWGYEKWVGDFVDDKPHGVGTMYLRDEASGGAGKGVRFEFVRGEPVLDDQKK